MKKIEWKCYVYSNVGGTAPKNFNLIFDKPSEIYFLCTGLNTATIDTCFRLSPIQAFQAGVATFNYELRLPCNENEYSITQHTLLLDIDNTVQVFVKYIV